MNLRWRYIVKPSLQIRFALFVFLSMSVVVFFVGWNAYYTLGSRFLSEMKDPQAVELFSRMNVLFWQRAALYTALLVAVAVLVSHKFAGPLYSIERAVDEWRAGRLRARLNLRQRDELRDLEEKLNDMAQALQAKVAADRVRRDQALAAMRALAAATGDEKFREAEKTLAAITEDFEV